MLERSELNKGEVASGELVVTSSKFTILLDPIDETLNDVAVFVGLLVELRLAPFTPAFAVRFLLGITLAMPLERR